MKAIGSARRRRVALTWRFLPPAEQDAERSGRYNGDRARPQAPHALRSRRALAQPSATTRRSGVERVLDLERRAVPKSGRRAQHIKLGGTPHYALADSRVVRLPSAPCAIPHATHGCFGTPAVVGIRRGGCRSCLPARRGGGGQGDADSAIFARVEPPPTVREIASDGSRSSSPTPIPNARTIGRTCAGRARRLLAGAVGAIARRG